MLKIYCFVSQNRHFNNVVGRRLAWALAHRASEQRKLLARQENLLVPDDRTGVLSSPAYVCLKWKLHSLQVKLATQYAYKRQEGGGLGESLPKTKNLKRFMNWASPVNNNNLKLNECTCKVTHLR